MKRDPRKTLRNKADKLFQEWGVMRYKHCLVCGKPMDCLHHFVTKGGSTTLRYDEDNGIPICASCHHRHHIGQDPTITITIREKMGDEWYARIKEKKNVQTSTTLGFYKSIIEDLEEQLLILENQ